MSGTEKEGLDPALGNLATLADSLARAIADGDVKAARDAHIAMGRCLDAALEERFGVVDLARERARRGPRQRKGK